MLLLVFLVFFAAITLALSAFALFIGDKILALIIALSSALFFTFAFFKFSQLRKVDYSNNIEVKPSPSRKEMEEDFQVYNNEIKVLQYDDPFVRKEKIRKEKNDWFLKLSVLLGALYFIYLIVYFSGAITDASGNVASELGTAIGIYILLPHFAAVALAVLFGIVSLFTKKRWPILSSAILYSISIVLFPMYFMFVSVQALFAFISFARKASV